MKENIYNVRNNRRLHILLGRIVCRFIFLLQVRRQLLASKLFASVFSLFVKNKRFEACVAQSTSTFVKPCQIFEENAKGFKTLFEVSRDLVTRPYRQSEKNTKNMFRANSLKTVSKFKYIFENSQDQTVCGS